MNSRRRVLCNTISEVELKNFGLDLTPKKWDLVLKISLQINFISTHY